jgi:hypothetical protein
VVAPSRTRQGAVISSAGTKIGVISAERRGNTRFSKTTILSHQPTNIVVCGVCAVSSFRSRAGTPRSRMLSRCVNGRSTVARIQEAIVPGQI